MRTRLGALFLLPLLATGCSTYCDVDCGACPSALAIDIVVAGGAQPIVTGSPELACTTTGDETSCLGDAEPGAYSYEIVVAGHPSRSVTLDVSPGGGGCCACEVEGDSAQVSFADADGGTD
jgi:hypothetical protein